MRDDIMSFEEVEFRETAEFLTLTLPHQLDKWPQYFISRERFLVAANEWLERCCDGIRHPRVVDDVDKGLMKRAIQSYPLSSVPYTPSTPSIPRAREPWEEWEDEYYGSYQPSVGWGPQQQNAMINGRKWWKYYTEPSLPATPKIAAPSGLSNVDMATVF